MELSKKNLLSVIEKNPINDCKIINLNIFGDELLIDISTSNPTLQSKKSIENSIKKIISENIEEKLDLKINFKIEKKENPQNQINRFFYNMANCLESITLQYFGMNPYHLRE